MTDRPRVAHLTFLDEVGVTRKLREEAAAARALGLPIDFYMIAPGLEDSDDGVIRCRRQAGGGRAGRSRFLADLVRREDLVSPYIDPAAYERIVIRFSKVFLSQGVTYSRHGARIVTEHHTDEMAELLQRRSLGRRVLAAVSLRRSRAALRRVAGLVAVTGEILGKELAKSGRKPGYVFPNGIGNVNPSGVRRSLSPGEPLRLAFAAADFQPWQGLDRLLAGLAAYCGTRPIELDVAGRLDPGQEASIASLPPGGRVAVRALGLIPVDEARALIDRAHLGIAGLALFRNGLREACPLKVREYAAQGLPFAYAFDDPDLPADWPYALKLPADESAIDVDAIVAFAEGLYSGGDPSPAIRAWAREKLEWKAKLPGLYAFLESVAAGKAPIAAVGAARP